MVEVAGGGRGHDPVDPTLVVVLDGTNAHVHVHSGYAPTGLRNATYQLRTNTRPPCS